MPVIEAIHADKFNTQTAYYHALHQAIKMAYVVGREDAGAEILEEARGNRKLIKQVKQIIFKAQNR